MDTLKYLYGIVPADSPDPPEELQGIESAPVRVARSGRLGGLISEVSAAAYSDAVLDARLSDLTWVGVRGLEHERVLDWFADQGPVVPLSLFSLHTTEARVLERLEADSDRFERVLRRLRGRREWGVKLWRDDARAAERLSDLSPAAAGLAREIEEAPPGKRFLLAKKLDSIRLDEMRRVSARISHEAYGHLRSNADDSVSMQIPPAATPQARTLLLHAAFLVAEERFETFRDHLSELAGALQPRGFDFELSGPWPAYHFADLDG